MNEISEYTLKETLDALRAGDPNAFGRLADLYRPLILSLSEKFLKSMPPDTMGLEDLMQEANIALYRAAVSYDTAQAKVTFGLYAKICIRNRLVSALRRQKRQQRAARMDEKKVSAGTAERIDWEAIRRQVSGILTKYEEQVLSLRLESYSYNEIAAKLKTDKKSVDNALYRIRRKLRQAQIDSKD